MKPLANRLSATDRWVLCVVMAALLGVWLAPFLWRWVSPRSAVTAAYTWGSSFWYPDLRPELLGSTVDPWDRPWLRRNCDIDHLRDGEFGLAVAGRWGRPVALSYSAGSNGRDEGGRGDDVLAALFVRQSLGPAVYAPGANEWGPYAYRIVPMGLLAFGVALGTSYLLARLVPRRTPAAADLPAILIPSALLFAALCAGGRWLYGAVYPARLPWDPLVAPNELLAALSGVSWLLDRLVVPAALAAVLTLFPFHLGLVYACRRLVAREDARRAAEAEAA